MKKLAIALCIIFLCGCGSSPNFVEGQIVARIESTDNNTKLTLSGPGYDGFKSIFVVREGFAKIGDLIIFEGDVLKVISKEEVKEYLEKE